jgi:hypothetical protein
VFYLIKKYEKTSWTFHLVKKKKLIKRAILKIIWRGKAKKLRLKYGIKYPSREGIFVIFGYPAVEYKKGVKRTFASVTIANG